MNQLPRSIDEPIKYLQSKGMTFPDKEAAADLIDEYSDSSFKDDAIFTTTIERYAVTCAIGYLCKAVNPQHVFANYVKQLCPGYADISLGRYGFSVRWEKEPLWR